MAYYSRAPYTGDGLTTDYTVPFPYLDRTHVKAYVNGTLTTAWSWTNSTTIRFTSAPASGYSILILRRTSPNARLVDYTADAAFDEETLDQDSTQAFYLFQEAMDQANTGFSYDPFGDNFAAVLTGTSTTSVTVGTGTKTFATQVGKSWIVGQRLRIANDDGTTLMEGEVTSYSGATLVVSVDYTEGAGTNADWNISVSGARGSPGDAGEAVTGPTGATGADGKTLRNGTGAPNNADGNNGDFYIATDTWTIYGPKAGGVWPAGASLVGATGSTGNDGADGATWLSGSGAPGGGSGVNGDFYFRTDTGQVYSKSAGSWSAIADLTGDTGPTGSTGPQGDPGADGVAIGYRYNFDTTTADADPGQGKVRADNATFASITKLYFDLLDVNAVDLTTWLDSLDDSTNSAKGNIRLQKTTDASVFMEFAVTAWTTAVGYRKITVTPVAGDVPANATPLAVTFYRSGDVGTAGAGSGDVTTTGAVTGGHIAKFNDGTGDVLADGGVLGALAALATVGTAQIDNNAVTYAKIVQGAGNSVVGRAAAGAGDNADITTSTDGHVLRMSGTTLGFGTLATASIADANVTYAKIQNVAGLSVVGRSTNSSGVSAAITGTDGQVLRVSGTTLGFGTIATAGIADANVTYAKIQNVAGLSVVGRSANSSGVSADITGTDGQVLRVSGTALGFGTIATAGIAANAVTNAKLAQMTATKIKARGTASTGDPEDIGVGAGLTMDATSLRADLGKVSVWVPANAMVARTTNGAAAGTAEMATNKNMVSTLDFDTTTQEFAQFDIRMPKSWNEGTVTFIPVWSHAATVTNFGVVWGLDAVAISDDDTLDVAFGTEQTSTDTGGTTNDLYQGPESSAITIAGSPAAGDLVQFRVHRNPANGSDTMAVDARLHGVLLLFTIDTLKDD